MNAIEANILITKMSHYWPMFKPDPDMAETWADALETKTLTDTLEALKLYTQRERRPATVADIMEAIRGVEAKRFSVQLELGVRAMHERYEEHYNLRYRFENPELARIGAAVELGADPEPLFVEWEERWAQYGYEAPARKEIAA